MKIALCQMSMTDNCAENFGKSISALFKAKQNKADIVIFPELQFNQFFPQYQALNAEHLALTINHGQIQNLQNACKDLGIYSIPNIYLREDSNFYDASLVVGSNGELFGIQKMVHVANFENFYEQDYYTPSNDGFKVFDTPLGKLGIVVCFDRHFPESVRTETIMGAQIIFIPTANHKDEPLNLFQSEICTLAFQNNIPIVMCNRVGKEGNLHFAGESLVVDAKGKIVLKASDEEEILYAELDLNNKCDKNNYLKYRRKEFYM